MLMKGKIQIGSYQWACKQACELDNSISAPGCMDDLKQHPELHT